ncbi:hypothetical protein [Geomesophilobacter sediminis]|uniref:hypothetical protein n=1 Tax=Geomesophilobacter sediminis TaxID=2798584 RepID=UPI001F27B1BE|nr:hypothetical protein [Geomesophilobacter sediminis]
MLHSSDIELNGEVFQIKVFSKSPSRFYATTCLGNDDFIITDGPTVPDALKKHEELLPLAVGTREITQSYMGFTRRSKARRT